MNEVSIIGLDLAENVFQAHGAGADGSVIFRRKLSRVQQFELSKHVSDESSRIRNEYIRAKDDGDSSKMSNLRTEWWELQDQKSRLRPFFGSGTEMRRQSVGDLIRAPRSQDRRERKAQKRFD